MTETEIHLCETGCARPAPSTLMCWDCVDDIVRAVERGWSVSDGLLAISRREMAPQLLRTEATTRPAYGPTEPMNLTALAILQDLRAWRQLTAADWSQVENPGWWHHWVQARVQMAVDMVEGEKETAPDLAGVRHRVKQEGAYVPMLVGTATAWLARYGIYVDKKRVGMWAARGKLHPNGRDHTGTALYTPAAIVAALHPTRDPEALIEV
ncbi:hypothetical protein [Citricoccus sp. K5]|uniref:hypothetical protein n=1 Tax=Citricoccus sp. K5 TaxID=2653135 RepID=UPI0012F0C54C|nr:hypothetical protein [Citricoccus sp. K5]VXA92625.1 hypothetical protein CITRIK5_100031 [Citricoccus sp. K5]VXA95193.1 hypothetical protein CITRIK5_100097 [Citricoccus sp. K5]